ncbi:MAG: glycosyltransferase, partial [Actinomycetes bacterium]
MADDRGTHASPLGDLVVLVAAGDVLLPDALARLALEADLDPLCDVFYTDEEQESTGGRAPQRFLKPDWSPELLLSMPYVLHCLGLRRDLFLQLGGLDSQSDEAAVHAFALRATTSARGIAHLPRVLCRRPAAIDVELDAGLGVVAEAAARLAPPARAASGFEPGTYRLVRRRRGRPPVTLVVISRDPVTHIHGRGELRILANFLTSIVERSTYPDYQVLVADDGELSEETLVAMSLVGARRVSIPRFAGPQEAFNFSRKVNFALEQIETEHFVLLNDDLEVITPEWIEALMDYAVIPDVGAVGAHLVFADGLTQHAGVIAGGPDGPTHRFYMLPQDAVDDHGPAKVVRDFSAVTAAVLASRREVVAAAGPFDEALALNYNDVDFC